MSTVEENVARGIVWLNENLGEDWPDFIDRETFDIADGTKCIAGQTFAGEYGEFADFIPSHRERARLGFTVRGDRYLTLQREWDNYLDEYELANA